MASRAELTAVHRNLKKVTGVKVGLVWRPVKLGSMRTEEAPPPTNTRFLWREPDAPDGTPGTRMKCRLGEIEGFRFADATG